MKKEAESWLKKAGEDFETAKYNFKGERMDAAVFYSQQAAEKALKALLIMKKGKVAKVHDLVFLARELGAPPEILQHAKELTLAYTYARYPGMPGIKDIKAKAKIFLEYSEGAIRWVKKEMS